MFCSTIVRTVGRPTLTRTVETILRQELANDDYEIIVVNDSGQSLPLAAWHTEPRVRILETFRRERCVAGNTGAAAAKGTFLHFLDDDDWIVPGAYQALYDLTQTKEADWYYGSANLMDREGHLLLQLHHEIEGNCFAHVMAGEWISWASSCIRTQAYWAVGGLHSWQYAGEDVDLCRRIALHGKLAGTTALIACLGMGPAGSLTDYAQSPAYTRRGRELILNERGVLPRLIASANTSYLWGRIVRLYLTSMWWNLRQRRLFTAASRFLFALTGVTLSGRHLINKNYWLALKGPHQSISFEHSALAMNSGTD